MQNNRTFSYKKHILKSYLKENTRDEFSEDISIIADYLKMNFVNKSKEKVYCKDELFLVGFNSFEIHKFFIPVRENLWKLKKFILYNNELIESFYDLCKALNLNNYNIAS